MSSTSETTTFTPTELFTDQQILDEANSLINMKRCVDSVNSYASCVFNGGCDQSLQNGLYTQMENKQNNEQKINNASCQSQSQTYDGRQKDGTSEVLDRKIEVLENTQKNERKMNNASCQSQSQTYDSEQTDRTSEVLERNEIDRKIEVLERSDIDRKIEVSEINAMKQEYLAQTVDGQVDSDILDRSDLKQGVYIAQTEENKKTDLENEIGLVERNSVKEGVCLSQKNEDLDRGSVEERDSKALDRNSIQKGVCITQTDDIAKQTEAQDRSKQYQAQTDSPEEIPQKNDILDRDKEQDSETLDKNNPNTIKNCIYASQTDKIDEKAKQTDRNRQGMSLAKINVSESNAIKNCSYASKTDQTDGKANQTDNKQQGIYLAQMDVSEPSLRMTELLEGVNEPGDCGNPAEPPPWLDMHLFERGRQFYKRFLICIFFSDLLALVMMFSVNRILRPLIYTGKSDTPWKALRRYVSTIMHVITWYSGDVWNKDDEAHKDVMKVRNIHMKYANMFNSSTHHPRVDQISALTKGHVKPKCPFTQELRQDLQCQVKTGYTQESNSTLYLSQWDMVVTQYSFMGLIVSHPRRLGAWWATDQDLEGFIHFWRGLGWLLGTDDRFNFCNGSLEETRALCLEMENHVMCPSIASSDWSYEHMCSSLLSGMNEIIPGLSFPGMIRLLGYVIGFRVPRLQQRMSYGETFRYWLMRFFLQVMFVVPGVVSVFNGMLRGLLDASTGHEPPLWLRWLPKSSLPPIVKPHSYS